jgi:hypothetical protein
VDICGRSTALHLASLYGHPKTAMALVNVKISDQQPTTIFDQQPNIKVQ